MEENNNVYVNTIDIPVEGDSQIVPVNNNGNEQIHEITKSEAIVGAAAGAGLTILLWEGAKLFCKRVVVPVCRKIVNKADGNVVDAKAKKEDNDPLEPAPNGAVENSTDPEKRKMKIPSFQRKRRTNR